MRIKRTLQSKYVRGIYTLKNYKYAHFYAMLIICIMHVNQGERLSIFIFCNTYISIMKRNEIVEAVNQQIYLVCTTSPFY